MKLTGLLDLSPSLPGFADLVAGLRAGTPNGAPVAVYHAARSFLVAALTRELNQPLVIVTPRTNRARQWVDELRVWLPDETPVHNFADPDALSYERIPWAPETRQRRLESLVSLLTWKNEGAEEQVRGGAEERRSGGADQRIGESANQRSSEAANQRISESANSESANGESANSESANSESANSEAAKQRISESANQRIANQRMANQRIANQRIANQRIANQRIAKQRMANRRIANRRATQYVIRNT